MFCASQYMSNSPVTPFSPLALQLEYFKPGQLDRRMNGVVHRKTVPDVIVAQVIEGRYGIVCEHREEILKAGEVFVIPSNQRVTITHHDSAAGRFRSRWIHMRYSWMGVFDYLQNYSLPLAVRGKPANRLGHCMKRALSLLGDSRLNPVSVALDIQNIALRVLEILCAVSQLQANSSSQDSRWKRLHPVLQAIQSHPELAYDIPALAKMVHLSESQFYQSFQSATGLTPMSYVWKVRLESVARLLIGTDDTLAQIAEKTGFSDAFHLSHKFKKTFGISPRNYRQQSL